MPHRRLARVPVPPGAPGVAAVAAALRVALDGGPALAPVPVPSVTVSGGYASAVLAALRPDDPHHPLESDDAAVVVATSGSTGDPRGVLLSADSLLGVARGPAGTAGAASAASAGAHYLAALPVTSIGGLQVVVRALLAGTEPEALPSVGGGEPFTPDVFTAATRRLADRAGGAPLRTSLVPAQLGRLLRDAPAAEALAGYDEVLLGGAAAPATLVAAAASAGVRVVRTYGMTETAGGCVYDGVPLPGVRVRLDPVVREQGPVDQVALGGPVVAIGYRLRPDETERRFVDGWFLTGDVGGLDGEGRLRVTGRIDDVVSVRGTSVAVGAVERCLAEQPGIADAAVVAVDGGDDGSRLVAFVVWSAPADAVSPASDTSPIAPPADHELARVRAAVRAALGPAAVPREVRTLPALPVLPGGKIDRSALRRRATSG